MLEEKSPKNKTKRCPKGERRNPKTGICEKMNIQISPKSPIKDNNVLEERDNITTENTNKSEKNINSPKNKTKRCPKGERRNPKTGICEKIDSPKQKKEEEENERKREKSEKIEEKNKKEDSKKLIIRLKKNKSINLSKMSEKEEKIFEKRKECIQKFRIKTPKNVLL
jgi:hypothetical protein